MLFHLLRAFGYLLGTALHTLIATLVMVRKKKRPSEKIFLFLVIAVGIWHAGNLVALFLGRVSHGETGFFLQFAQTAGLIGLAAFPALLVHTHVAFLRETEADKSNTKLQNVLLAVMYAPLIWFFYPLFSVILSQVASPVQALTHYMLQYVCWFVTALVVSAIIDFQLARIQEDEPFQHFYRVIGSMFWFIVFLTTFTYILGGRELSQLRSYLEIAGILASIVPSTILAYFIYRYNFLELVIRRSFFVITLSVVIF